MDPRAVRDPRCHSAVGTGMYTSWAWIGHLLNNRDLCSAARNLLALFVGTLLVYRPCLNGMRERLSILLMQYVSVGIFCGCHWAATDALGRPSPASATFARARLPVSRTLRWPAGSMRLLLIVSFCQACLWVHLVGIDRGLDRCASFRLFKTPSISRHQAPKVLRRGGARQPRQGEGWLCSQTLFALQRGMC